MYTIGTDPELMLTKNGRYVSAIPYTNGTKDSPELLPSGGSVSYDNVNLEFNTLPALTHPEFIWNVGTVLKDLKAYLPDDVKMAFVSSANFPRKELKHKDAKEFGCSPDYNAWSGTVNRMPRKAARSTFRSAGAHIHVRHIKESGHFGFLLHEMGKQRTVFAMDITLGMASTVLDYNEASIARKKLYGKAGCYRATEGGVEYRTLSNYWIKSPNLVHLMHLLTDFALTIVATDQVEIFTMQLGGPHNIQRIITEGDAEMATVFMEQFLIPRMPKDTQELYWKCFLECDDYNPEKEWEL